MKERSDHEKAVVVMAIMHRQIQEAKSLNHFVELIRKLSEFSGVSVIKLAAIYQSNFSRCNRGYFNVHPDRVGEEYNPD